MLVVVVVVVVVVVAGLDVCKHATLSHGLVREQHTPVAVVQCTDYTL